jgi:hypothetical protein
MSAPTSSAEIVPTHERSPAVRAAGSMSRLPTLDEVPAPSLSARRSEVVVYSGISFGQQRQQRRAYSTATTTSAPTQALPSQASISGIEMFSDDRQPGQVYARIMILEPGSLTPREALITPLVTLNQQDKQQLDARPSMDRLVERANLEMTKFFNGIGPIDSEIKMKEFRSYIERQESLNFLFSNLSNKNRTLAFDLFSAYFSPGGAMSGVGVFVNTWL